METERRVYIGFRLSLPQKKKKKTQWAAIFLWLLERERERREKGNDARAARCC